MFDSRTAAILYPPAGREVDHQQKHGLVVAILQLCSPARFAKLRLLKSAESHQGGLLSLAASRKEFGSTLPPARHKWQHRLYPPVARLVYGGLSPMSVEQGSHLASGGTRCCGPTRPAILHRQKQRPESSTLRGMRATSWPRKSEHSGARRGRAETS